MKYLILFAFMSLLFSCKKTDNIENNGIEIETYKNITTKSLGKFMGKGVEIPNFPTEEEILNHDTYLFKYMEGGGEIDTIFSTSIFREDEISSCISGFIGKEGRILNIVTIPQYFFNDNISLIDVYYIDGTQIGSYTIQDDKITNISVVGNLEDDNTPADQARSWWGCTKECIKDVNIACNLDKHCMTMLFISNIRVPGVPSGGFGSMSIAGSCGIQCVRNRNMDLLPQY